MFKKPEMKSRKNLFKGPFMNIFRVFTCIIIFMIHSPAKGKSWKEIIQKRIFNESNQILCEGDIYKSKNGTSPLMKRVIEAVKKVKDKAI